MRAIERICLYLVVGYVAVALIDVARAQEEQASVTPAQPVVTRELQIHNAAGKVVMRLGEAEGGGGQIQLYSAEGVVAARLIVRTDHDGELRLYDDKGRLRANIGGNDDGGYANFYSKTDKMALYVGADSAADAGYVGLYKEGTRVAEMLANKSGGSFAASCAKTQKRVAELGAAADSGTGLLGQHECGCGSRG